MNRPPRENPTPQHFGALPGPSATDLAAALIHDIEEARIQGKDTTLLTLDIKGAFDAVLPGRLIRWLQDQGWPTSVVRWVHSFVTGRRGRMRLDGYTGEHFSIDAGVPQGSPASPILFMLYLQPLFHLGNPSRKSMRFRYADDIAIICTSKSLDSNIRVLENGFELLNNWANEQGLAFETNKTELMHFSRRKHGQNPPITLRAGETAQTIEATNTEGAVRYLGIWLDRTLTFKHHVQKMASKATRITTASGHSAIQSEAPLSPSCDRSSQRAPSPRSALARRPGGKVRPERRKER